MQNFVEQSPTVSQPLPGPPSLQTLWMHKSPAAHCPAAGS